MIPTSPAWTACCLKRDEWPAGIGAVLVHGAKAPKPITRLNRGVAGACSVCEELLGRINTRGGKLTCRPVAEAHGLVYTAPAMGGL